MDYTHFLSIPLNFLKDAAGHFYDEILLNHDAENTQGFDPSIILAPEKLHLTVLMLKLFSKQELQKAVELLQQCSPKVYDLLGSRTEVLKVQVLCCYSSSSVSLCSLETEANH